MYKAIVTGASSGIGKAIYEGLKKEGFETIGISRHGPDHKINVELPPSNWKKMFEDIDLLVNCAGIMPLYEGNPKKIFDVNFWGTYSMIQKTEFNKGACIINIASVSGVRPDPDLPIYAASKAAVISLTKSLAKKCAPDIRVNCISPGFYKTNLVPGKIPQEFIDTIPLGYAEQPQELMDVVMMIWNTKYLTGSNIIVDGGVSL